MGAGIFLLDISSLGEVNGPDAHMPSNLALPQKGEWAFLLSTDDELFNILV